ncbi:DUF3772 domain-containing protein [Bordetella holmesii]|uniref:Transporter, small conductance mechanosensitive ion channel MscS family protein n=2 Tax=Bordetella holmesii TaxID=35814 RepID=A0A158M0E9_9BORD|nr:mechanosensitive ion channel family protein [Bordetella holmesii 30539]KAK81701.1 transporter, small conductance mechanosensitive ion channel MscS family protein [Bordetella holmesii H620]KAK83109.1 transporter, small conductance mechanosensitive ion channel MscS family protein [Bordetella holmesii CDC-H809-BH]KAK86653.1 transporter, small conductance mechanosensitive ion channel MscS family protein [Bordetella holmesii CDC-H585-BH]KAK88001.1 transporter, small conductance mechanosensitive i
MKPTLSFWRMACMRLFVVLSLALALGNAAGAPPATAAADAETTLAEARKTIDALRKDLDQQTNDDVLVQRRSDALQIQAQADAIAEALAPQQASVTARLTELGPIADGARDTPDVAAQRAQLEKNNRNLDAQVKLARLLSVEAAQTAEQISALRRTQFQAKLGERRGSLLASSFWSELRGELPRDLSRLSDLLDDLYATVADTPGWVWTSIAVLVAVGVALRYWAGQMLLRLTATRVPPGRLRRSVLAVAVVALSTLAPALVAELVVIGLTWHGEIADDVQILLTSLVEMAAFGGFVAGLGYALLSIHRPSWRLPPLPDVAADGLRRLPLTLGILVVAAWLAERLPVLINASLTGTIALNSLVVTVMTLVLMAALARTERLRRRLGETPPPRPLWLAALTVIAWIVLGLSLLALLTGYAALGSFLVRQTIWTLIVMATAYLASVLIDDGFTTLLGGPAKEEPPTLQTRLRGQAGVLLSGVGRLMVILIAVVLLLAPFGEAPTDLLHRLDQLYKGLQIGEVQIRPGAVAQALLVLAAGLLSVRLLKRWLATRYLLTTELDPGMQVSAATLFGYAGVVVAVALALSALGIGLERVAWIASALSVGIGFGLQAVVQNFVSGLILLAERPVKVGDWVSLGGIEGDIQRINVRATEIQMSDRSTVIVPNSEFITKTVRNVTHANPIGLVQIKLPMPLSTDAQQVRQIMLEAFAAHENILESPAPNVYLDGIDNGHLLFNAKAYVSSPRTAYGVRSALLFEMLRRLDEAGLEMSSPNTMVLRADNSPPLEPPPSSAAAPL